MGVTHECQLGALLARHFNGHTERFEGGRRTCARRAGPRGLLLREEFERATLEYAGRSGEEWIQTEVRSLPRLGAALCWADSSGAQREGDVQVKRFNVQGALLMVETRKSVKFFEDGKVHRAVSHSGVHSGEMHNFDRAGVHLQTTFLPPHFREGEVLSGRLLAPWTAPGPWRQKPAATFSAGGQLVNRCLKQPHAEAGKLQFYGERRQLLCTEFSEPHEQDGEVHHFESVASRDVVTRVTFATAHPRHGEIRHFFQGSCGRRAHLLTTYTPEHARHGGRVFFNEQAQPIAVLRLGVDFWAFCARHRHRRCSARCEAAARCLVCDFCCQEAGRLR